MEESKGTTCILYVYPATLEIHLNKVLTNKLLHDYHALECHCEDDKNRPGWITNLMKLDGVTMVRIKKYSIHISKGEVFFWDNMANQILKIILNEFEGPLGELVFIKPAQVNYLSTDGKYHWKDWHYKIINPFKIDYQAPKKKPGIKRKKDEEQ